MILTRQTPAFVLLRTKLINDELRASSIVSTLELQCRLLEEHFTLETSPFGFSHEVPL